jgi:creatinine amidohydrolase
MRSSVFLDELTDPEVAAYLKGYPAMVLIPTGSTEQHGAHGPLGTDVIIPREVCRRVAEVKSALVAPPVPYGLSAGHQGFKGLASLNTDTYLKVIEDITLSFGEAGFRRIVFINGHYTNYPAINLALLNASPRLPEKTRAFAMSYWDALPSAEAEAYLSLSTGLHANIGETSAVLAVRPELVKMEKAEAGWPPFPTLKGPAMPTILAFFETQAGSCYKAMPGGVWGDPTESTAELGEQYYDQIARAVCNVIDDTESTYSRMNVKQRY